MDEGRLLAARGLLVSSCPLGQFLPPIGAESWFPSVGQPGQALGGQVVYHLLFVLLSRGILGCPDLAEAALEDYCPPTPGSIFPGYRTEVE